MNFTSVICVLATRINLAGRRGSSPQQRTLVMLLEPYLEQTKRWPTSGRHIMAQYDDQSIIVYQAYRPAIGRFAVEHGYFGGEFKLTRMSWIKPNFLWMMYRSGWAQKEGQEMVLAVRILRSAFDEILSQAVASTFQSDLYETREAWQRAVAQSEVRLQFDPDHDPNGTPLSRRAIQLGLRGEVLKNYAQPWIVEIQDISTFVQQQHQLIVNHQLDKLMTPAEKAYVPYEAIRRRLRLDT